MKIDKTIYEKRKLEVSKGTLMLLIAITPITVIMHLKVGFDDFVTTALMFITFYSIYTFILCKSIVEITGLTLKNKIYELHLWEIAMTFDDFNRDDVVIKDYGYSVTSKGEAWHFIVDNNNIVKTIKGEEF